MNYSKPHIDDQLLPEIRSNTLTEPPVLKLTLIFKNGQKCSDCDIIHVLNNSVSVVFKNEFIM